MKSDNIRIMNVSITGRLRDRVQDRIADGRFTSASDCIRDLIRADTERPGRLGNLRRLIQEGIESGKPSTLDMSQVISEAHRRFDR